MEAQRKALSGFEWKEDGAQPGSFVAIFSSFGTIDSYGDVAKEGAFPEGKEVMIGAFGHESVNGALPIGKGSIRSEGGLTYVDGQFFTDMAAGLETYKMAKNAGALLEWSYIYVPTKYSYGDLDGKRVRFLEEVDVWSVDPVLKGAGAITGTVEIKSPAGNATLVEQIGAARAAASGAVERVKALAALRAQDGRAIAGETLEEAKGLLADFEAHARDLDALINPPPDLKNEVIREIARNTALQGRAL